MVCVSFTFRMSNTLSTAATETHNVQLTHTFPRAALAQVGPPNSSTDEVEQRGESAECTQAQHTVLDMSSQQNLLYKTRQNSTTLVVHTTLALHQHHASFACLLSHLTCRQAANTHPLHLASWLEWSHSQRWNIFEDEFWVCCSFRSLAFTLKIPIIGILCSF